MFVILVNIWQWCPLPPHLVAAGGQALSKGLDGAGLVELYQLCEASICLIVSSQNKLPLLILGDDKMAAAVMAPLKKKQGPKKKKGIGQAVK